LKNKRRRIVSQEGTIIPQAILPLIPPGSTSITETLSVFREDEYWTYYCGLNPIFVHRQEDQSSFRMFTSQLACQGQCKQVEIERAFGVSSNSVKRNVKKYRQEGIAAFYAPRKGRGPSVLTEPVTARAQELFDLGHSRNEVSEELGIKSDTLRKAIQAGRIHEGKPTVNALSGTDKSQRSSQDAAAEMGTACTRPLERTLAAFGLLNSAQTRFETCRDVSMGGVICALPALAANGLLRHLKDCFSLPKGYYTTLHIMILLAYMALCRIKTAEQLRYESPGELGKSLGLDRIPEVRCLRKKVAQLSADDAAQRWSTRLGRDWMEAAPELAGTLYIDGHVRVYHGRLTKLPRRYISRERLCLRGTTDYWVNDALGQPFFVIERAVDEGLLKTLRKQIVPRLLDEVPNQPSQDELEADPLRHRFILVFDREGYSPKFFQEMWKNHRIACITYHKYPKQEWPPEQFSKTEMTMPNGEPITMKLAEQKNWVGDSKNGLWVREVRKRTESGHQTSIISTAFSHFSTQDAAWMFSRWSQENFFGYMMQHFAMDSLSEYGTEEIPGPQPVVNPKWRKLDANHRSLKGKLNRKLKDFAALELHPEMNPKHYQKWETKKAELTETILHMERQLEEVAELRKTTPHHIPLEQLEKQDLFQRLAPSRRQLIDTIKMVAYRAETAMAVLLRRHLARSDDARPLLRDLYRSEADLIPDNNKGILTVQVHNMADPRANRAIRQLLNHLNQTEFIYPATNMKLVFTMTEEH
jgi:biotin operon repressor